MKLPFDVKVTAGRLFINLSPEIAAAILRTVKAGWALALQSPEVNSGAHEVNITERLRDGMRCALRSGHFPWNRSMVVLPGTESRSRPEVRVPDGRTDIPILWIEIIFRFGEHDPHAIIECKRIAGNNTSMCRAYVVEGIDRFQTGKYSGNHSIGFMIGYLIAGDANAAVLGVNRYLKRKSRLAEKLKPSNLIDESWARRSRHPRTTPNSPIELHHAFLAFTAAGISQPVSTGRCL